MPRVSVIVPAFNYGHFLPKTLDSMRAQTLADWECVIVDDGSTDNTREIVRHYERLDTRFVYVHQQNKGLSAARNTGLTRARSDYVQLLDADDFIETDKLRFHATFLDSHPECDVVYGAAHYFRTGPDGKKKQSTRRDVFHEKGQIQQAGRSFLLALIEKNLFPVSAPLWRRALIEEVGYFDEALLSHEDWDLWLRMALSGKCFAFASGAGAGTLIREHSRGLTGRQVTMAETRIEVRKHILAGTADAELLLHNKAAESYDLCMLGGAYLKALQLSKGILAARQGLGAAENKTRAFRLLFANLAPSWLLEAYRWTRQSL